MHLNISSIFIFILVLCGDTGVTTRTRLVHSNPGWSRYSEVDLVQRLIRRGAMHSARPQRRHPNETVFIVKCRLYLIRIQKIDELEEVFYSTIRLQLNWQDPQLSWDPDEFGGLKEAVVPNGKLWVPPLHIANSIYPAGDITRSSAEFPYRVHSNGKVWFHPTGQASTRCKFDLTYYPFDLQRCLIIIESEVYQEKEMKIIPREDDNTPGPISFGMFAENEIWELLREHTFAQSKVYKSGKSTSFSRIHFVVVMQRKPGFFVITVLIPTIILATITLLVYFVPVHYVDRPVQSVTTVLAVAIFQSTVAESLPRNSANCLLTSYLTVVMCSSAVTVLTTTSCLAVVDPGEYIKAPWGIPNISKGVVARARKFFRRCQKTHSEGNAVDITPTEQKNGSSLGNKTSSIDLTKSKVNVRKRRNWAVKAARTRIGSSSSFGSGHIAQIVRRKHILLPGLQSKNPDYEPGRRLLSQKQSWYIAYALNWTGFFICLIVTLAIPVMAIANKANDDENFIKLFGQDDATYFATEYYGA